MLISSFHHVILVTNLSWNLEVGAGYKTLADAANGSQLAAEESVETIFWSWKRFHSFFLPAFSLHFMASLLRTPGQNGPSHGQPSAVQYPGLVRKNCDLKLKFQTFHVFSHFSCPTFTVSKFISSLPSFQTPEVNWLRPISRWSCKRLDSAWPCWWDIIETVESTSRAIVAIFWRCRTSHWFSGTLQVEVHWDWKCGSAVNFCDFIEIGQCMHPAFSCPVDMIWKSIAVSCLARSWLQRVMEAFGQSASWRRAPWEVQSDEMLSKPSRLSKLVNFCLFVLSMFAPSWNRYDRYSYTCFVWITEGFQTCQVVKPHWNLRSKKLEVAGPRVAEVVEELHFDATQRQRCVRCEAGNDLWNVIVECAFDVGIDRKSCASNVQQCTWGDASFGRLVGSLRFAGSSTGRHQNTSASQPLTLRLRWYKIQDSVIEKENCFQAQKCPIWPDAGSLPGSRIFFARIALLDSLDRMFLTRPINFSGVIQFVTCWGPPVLSLEVRLNCIRRKNTSVYGSVAPRLRHVRQVHLFKLQLGSQLSQLSQCLLWWTLWVWIHILWLWCVFCSRSLWRVRKIHQAYKTSFWVASAGFFGVHLCKSIPSVRQNLLSLEMSAG